MPKVRKESVRTRDMAYVRAFVEKKTTTIFQFYQAVMPYSCRFNQKVQLILIIYYSDIIAEKVSTVVPSNYNRNVPL